MHRTEIELYVLSFLQCLIRKHPASDKLGISILPKLIIRNFEDQIASYPLDPYYYRTLGVAVKAKDNMSPAAMKFFNLTKEMIPELM